MTNKERLKAKVREAFSELQKVVWAERSKAERSAISKKILDSRAKSPKWKAFVKNASKIVGKNGLGNVPWNTGKSGYKMNLSPEGRERIREAARRNGLSPEREKKRMSTVLKKMTPEARKKYRARLRFKELRRTDPAAYRAEISRRIAKGKRRSWKDPKVRAKTVASIKKAWVEKHDERLKFITPEYRKKRSEWGKRYGDHSGLTGARKAWYYGPNGRRIWMFSRAEVRYAKWLDSQGIEWLYEAFTFAVVMNGKLRHWTPDFYLVKERKFVEIKGREWPQIQRKIKRVMARYSGTKFELLRDSRIPKLVSS